jgi:hypothetical protein
MHDLVNCVSPPLFPATGVAEGMKGKRMEWLGGAFVTGEALEWYVCRPGFDLS